MVSQPYRNRDALRSTVHRSNSCLVELEVDALILAALQTHICGLLSAQDAYLRRYRMWIPGGTVLLRYVRSAPVGVGACKDGDGRASRPRRATGITAVSWPPCSLNRNGISGIDRRDCGAGDMVPTPQIAPRYFLTRGAGPRRGRWRSARGGAVVHAPGAVGTAGRAPGPAVRTARAACARSGVVAHRSATGSTGLDAQ